MRAGRLRHRVIIQSPTGSRDSLGERETTWTNVLTNEPAAIEPISQKQRIAASQEYGSVTHLITMRYQSALASMDNAWRITWGDRIFVFISNPINVDEKNRSLQVLCEEGMKEE